MMNRSTLTMWKLLAAGFILLGLAACESQTAYKDDRNAAEKRWMTVRSALMLQMAQQQFDTGDLDQAQASLTNAMSVDRDNPHIYVLLGRVELERGQLEKSSLWLKVAIEKGPKVAAGFYYMGVVQQRWQQFDKALESYRQAMALASDNPAYMLAYAEMLVETDQAELAMTLLKDKLAFFDQNAGVRLAIAQLHMIRNEPAEAIGFFRQAAVLRPDDLSIQEDLARALIRTGEYGDAARLLERLARDPEVSKHRDVDLMLGEAYLKTDRPHEARDVFVRMTREDKNDSIAWLNLGEASWTLQDDLGALTAARHAFQLDPKQAKAYLLAGMVLQKRDQVAQATEMFDLAAAHAPEDATPRILQGIMYQRAGRTDAAAEAFTDALRRQPDDVRAQKLLASVENVPPNR